MMITQDEETVKQNRPGTENLLLFKKKLSIIKIEKTVTMKNCRPDRKQILIQCYCHKRTDIKNRSEQDQRISDGS